MQDVEHVWNLGDEFVQGIQKSINVAIKTAVLDYFGNITLSYSEYEKNGMDISDKLSVYMALPEPLDHISKRVAISDLLEEMASDHTYGMSRGFVDREAETYLVEIEAKIASIRARYEVQAS